MRQHRTFDEYFIDEGLTLSLLAEHQSRPGATPMDRMRLQTLIFLVTYAWFDQRWKGFNYAFSRNRHGPFCRDLYLTEVDLAAAGLVHCGPMWSLTLTELGRQWANEFAENIWSVGSNARFWECLTTITRQQAAIPASELAANVCAMQVLPLGWRGTAAVCDVPNGIDLTRILEEDEAEEILAVAPEWLESIAYLMTTPVEQELRIPVHAV